jgi:hypothetical protein
MSRPPEFESIEQQFRLAWNASRFEEVISFFPQSVQTRNARALSSSLQRRGWETNAMPELGAPVENERSKNYVVIQYPVRNRSLTTAWKLSGSEWTLARVVPPGVNASISIRSDDSTEPPEPVADFDALEFGRRLTAELRTQLNLNDLLEPQSFSKRLTFKWNGKALEGSANSKILGFGWPAPIQAVLTMTNSREGAESVLRCLLKVEPEHKNAGAVIEIMRLEALSIPSGVKLEQAQSLLSQVSRFPSFRTDGLGDFQGCVNLDKYLEEKRSIVQKHSLKKLSACIPFLDMMESSAPQAALERYMEKLWLACSVGRIIHLLESGETSATEADNGMTVVHTHHEPPPGDEERARVSLEWRTPAKLAYEEAARLNSDLRLFLDELPEQELAQLRRTSFINTFEGTVDATFGFPIEVTWSSKSLLGESPVQSEEHPNR